MSKPRQAAQIRTHGSRQNEMQDQMERPVGALSRIDKTDLPEPRDRSAASLYARSTVAGWNMSWGPD